MRMVIILSQIVIVVIIKMIINFNSNDENYHQVEKSHRIKKSENAGIFEDYG